MTGIIQVGPSAAATQIVSAGDGETLVNVVGPANVFFGDGYAIRATDAVGTITMTPGSFFTVDGKQDLYACVASGTTSSLNVISGGLNFFIPPSLSGLGGARVFVQLTAPTGSIPLNSLWFNTTLNSIETWNGAAWVTQTFSAQQLIVAGTILAAQIGANAGILGSQLSAAAGIVGGQVANGTLTTAQLAAAAGILGTQIAQNTVTGGTTGNLALTTITAANIFANTIGVGQLVTNLIYAGIVNGTIIKSSFFLSGSGGGVNWQNSIPSTPGYFLYYDPGIVTLGTTPAVPASTVAVTNSNAYAVTVNVIGGTVTNVLVNAVSLLTGDGSVTVPSGQTISITYSVAPTWTWVPVQIAAVPATTVAATNPNPFPVQVVITGGTLTQVIVNSVQVGTTAGTYFVPSLGTISITYSVAPTWAWTQMPQLIYALSASAGSDQWGNTWQGGVTLIALPGILPNVLSVTDANSNKLGGIDSDGSVTGQNVFATVDVFAGGNSLTQLVANSSQGIITRGWAPSVVGSLPWPSTAIGTTATALLELDVLIPAGRSFLIQVLPCFFIPTVAANTQMVQRILFTTNGTTPTTASPEATGHSPGITSIASGLTGFNFASPYMEYIPATPVVDTTYKFLLVANIQAGTFKYQNLLEMRVTDNGADLGQMGNNGIILGSGGSGGGGGAQNYTETFPCTFSESWDTGFGVQNTNGSILHGAYSGDPGYRYGYFSFGTGSRGNALATVLNYTVNSVTLRLTNQHSWYNNGMRFGLHSSTVLGATGYSNILNPGGTFITEGATTTFTLSSTQWAPFKTAGTFMVLAPDSADQTNLSWYGYFAGPGSQAPLLTVKYTH